MGMPIEDYFAGMPEGTGVGLIHRNPQCTDITRATPTHPPSNAYVGWIDSYWFNNVFHQKDDAGNIRGYTSLAAAGGVADRVPYFNGAYSFASDDGFKFSTGAGLIINDGGVAAIDTRIETDNITHAVFVDAGTDQVLFGTATAQTWGYLPLATSIFAQVYFDAPDNATAERNALFVLLNADVTASVAAKYSAMSVSSKVDVSAGITSSGFQNGLYIESMQYAADSHGTLAKQVGCWVWSGIQGTDASPPAITEANCYYAGMYGDDGDIDDFFAFKCEPEGTPTATIDRVWGFFADPIIGTETYGFYGVDAISDGYSFTTIAQVTADQNNWSIGDGVNYNASSDAARTIRGIRHSASAANRDGRRIFIFNAGAQQMIFTHLDAAATAGNRIHDVAAAGFTLNAGEALEAVYDPAADSAAGAWVAWKV